MQCTEYARECLYPKGDIAISLLGSIAMHCQGLRKINYPRGFHFSMVIDINYSIQCYALHCHCNDNTDPVGVRLYLHCIAMHCYH